MYTKTNKLAHSYILHLILHLHHYKNHTKWRSLTWTGTYGLKQNKTPLDIRFCMLKFDVWLSRKNTTVSAAILCQAGCISDVKNIAAVCQNNHYVTIPPFSSFHKDTEQTSLPRPWGIQIRTERKKKERIFFASLYKYNTATLINGPAEWWKYPHVFNGLMSNWVITPVPYKHIYFARDERRHK